jgi:hypothetical protein
MNVYLRELVLLTFEGSSPFAWALQVSLYDWAARGLGMPFGYRL